jgi:hypothetical protein
MKLEAIKYGIPKLSIDENKSLIEFIKSSYSIFDDYSAAVNSCPQCYSKHIVKNGLRNVFKKTFVEIAIRTLITDQTLYCPEFKSLISGMKLFWILFT